MKILFVGHIDEGQTSLMRMRALERLGHEVVGVNSIRPWLEASWTKRQLQRRLRSGSIVRRINEDIVSVARQFHPDLIWTEKQEHLEASTLDDLRRLGAKLLHFTPDPYYSLNWKRTRTMDEALPLFDVLVYCKAYEREHYERAGPLPVYMPLGFCDEVHRPVRSVDRQWSCEVGFLGGWEPRREHMLRAVASTGADLKIWGTAWEFLLDGQWTLRRSIVLRQLAGSESFKFHRDPLLAKALQGGEVYGDEYSSALSGARIGIGFLRTVCADQHTTRTFEIPACGSMLLADRTSEHQNMFEEGEEAEFFASPEEMIDKVRFYVSNSGRREKIAQNGLERCRTARYAYIHRISDALLEIRKDLPLPV